MLSMPAFLLLMCLLVLGAAGAGAATKEPAIYEIRADGTGHRLIGGHAAPSVRTSLVVERTEAVLHRGAVNSGRR
jgi:hypothetical protein